MGSITGLLALSSALVACRRDDGPAAHVPDYVAQRSLRRLTVVEYQRTVGTLLDDSEFDPSGKLPEDYLTPFDDDATTQVPSRVLVEVGESLARDAAQSLVGDPDRLSAWLPCTPAGPEDRACLTQVVEQFGRLALHRPLSADEVGTFVDLGAGFAADGGDFAVGVEVVVRAFLQDPEFLYRVEVGAPVPGHPELRQLDGYEIAARMALLLWGNAPDDWLLDQAETGHLDDRTGRAEVARLMLDDPRALDQIDRFHAMWLGYEHLSVGLISYESEDDLAAEMRAETRALVERVVFEDDAPWTELLVSPETFLTEQLSKHYDIDGTGWVDVRSTGRSGILGQGSFLATAGNVLDTSPTKRGKLVRERLMCKPVPPPPPDVPADAPPPENEAKCKIERYEQHRRDASCAGCHDFLDPVGFGLENYDLEGRYRAYDYWPESTISNRRCPIDGEGEIPELGTFHGPAELAELLVETDTVQGCAVQQVLQYANGKPNDPDDLDYAAFLADRWDKDDLQLDELLVDFVSSASFAHRREE